MNLSGENKLNWVLPKFFLFLRADSKSKLFLLSADFFLFGACVFFFSIYSISALGGSLFNYLKAREKLEEIEIRFYMFQVLKVLKYFRLQKLVHRDLTLSNIFLKDYKTVKISDFGFAYKENELLEKEEEVCGTPGYYPPESHLSKYSYKTDIFYFGMCIYYLFGGKYMLNTSQQSYDFFCKYANNLRNL